MAETFYVSLDLQSAVDAVDKAVLEQSWTGEHIDHYSVPVPGAGSFVQLVYEKYYMRAGNHLTLGVFGRLHRKNARALRGRRRRRESLRLERIGQLFRRR